MPGIDDATFREKANAAKVGCPVSQALSAVPITLEAAIVHSRHCSILTPAAVSAILDVLTAALTESWHKTRPQPSPLWHLSVILLDVSSLLRAAATGYRSYALPPAAGADAG